MCNLKLYQGKQKWRVPLRETATEYAAITTGEKFSFAILDNQLAIPVADDLPLSKENVRKHRRKM